VKLNDPAATGVPLSKPEVNVNPVGNVPALIVCVYGGPTPPRAVTVCEYAAPTEPPGNVVGDNVIGGVGVAVTVSA
jgi:hypothetical protein